MKNAEIGIYQRYLKRPLDFILSSLAIIILSPIFIIVSILVKSKLGSPILFKQQRPGLNEKVFTMYKFRTMTDEKDISGNLLPDKVRLTKFGKFLRSTSLDELPGLFNIVKGDMSIVGPRPLSVLYLPHYNSFEKQRHNVRPGLTGLAQVNGRNTVSWETRFAFDVEYVTNLSFLFDIKIIIKTILVVFQRRDVVVRGTGSIGNFQDYRMKQNESSDLNERGR